MEDIFKGRGIEVKLFEDSDFLKIKETLERIGISSKSEKKLWPSCNILHKQGRYAILHFKELMELDGKQSNISENDIARRNTISNLLEHWGLLSLVYPEESKEPIVPVSNLKILSFKEKASWEITPKYTIGKKKI